MQKKRQQFLRFKMHQTVFVINEKKANKIIPSDRRSHMGMGEVLPNFDTNTPPPII